MFVISRQTYKHIIGKVTPLVDWRMWVNFRIQTFLRTSEKTVTKFKTVAFWNCRKLQFHSFNPVQPKQTVVKWPEWNIRQVRMNRLRPSAGDEQVPHSPPQPLVWDQWRQKSVRWNWCGHQVEDPLTARLAWTRFDCWCTLIRCHASARQFYFSRLLKVFSSD